MNNESSMIQRIEALPEARKNTILETMWLCSKLGPVNNSSVELLINSVYEAESECEPATNCSTQRKLPEIPSWVPQLPEGYVPLGFGETFKIPFDGLFYGRCCWRTKLSWSYFDASLQGDEPIAFYIAPRNSKVAKLNYPWLATETASSEDFYEQEQRDDEADNTPCSLNDTVLVEGIGTMLRGQAAAQSHKCVNDDRLRDAYTKAANGPAYKEEK